MKKALTFMLVLVALTSCQPSEPQSAPTPGTTDDPQANLPNPASVYCERQGYTLEIRTAEDGSQSGVCLFPDGSECDEWAYYRGECGPAAQNEVKALPAEFPTSIPVDPNAYQGWWTYTHPEHGFSFMLPEDWEVDETTTSDPLMNGHMLNLSAEGLNIRMTFRRSGEEIPLWPTGVGQGQFVPQGTLDVSGQPVQRVLLVCPTGEVTAIWYRQAEGQPDIARGDLEFGMIFSAGSHCESGYSLEGKTRLVGEMIIASLQVP